jgi:sensor c-di-GMP phosphodiesterase-like protein
MMRVLKSRARLTLIVALVALAVGVVGGYLLVLAITVRVTEIKLQQYAARIMADGEASSAELRTVLAAVSASRHSPCSGAEIGYFRALIFESDYLKDAGRMRDGSVECSAALGRMAHARGQSEPDFTQQDGTKVYEDLAPYNNNGLTVITMQLGEGFVAFTPFSRMHLDPLPMHYTEVATDEPTQKTVRMLGEQTEASVPILTTEGVARVGDKLYATRCSIRFFSCVTAFTSIPELIQADRAWIAGSVALCGLLSCLAGVVISFLYRRNKSVEQQLRRAIARDHLQVFYQPIVHLASRRIVGAEALARWNDEEGLAVSPEVFVKIAEERGFVGTITRLVLRHALSDLGAALREDPDFRLSINVAADDLKDPEFLPMLENSLERAGVKAPSLAIEITEGSTVRHDMAIEAICRLRQNGHSVHIDDFGTGYSCLAYLHDLSVDAIKIDKAFTQAVGTEAVTVAILPQILALAAALNLRVIVEGVETEEQSSYFADGDNSILAQGWLFGRAVPASEFRSLLATDRKKTAGPADVPCRSASPEPLRAA